VLTPDKQQLPPSLVLEDKTTTTKDENKNTKKGRKRKRKKLDKNAELQQHLERVNKTLDKVRSKKPNTIPFIRLAFFAVRDIKPLEELCWDYGYKKGSVENKNLKCLCGTSSCREYLY